jgi:5-(carboxyamino)imidazole ribonucleotide synthase
MSAMSDGASREMILPGAWLGVFGGGQLGRMFARSAQTLGYHVAVFEPEANSPAGQVADRQFAYAAQAGDAERVAGEFARLCAAVTLEFENIDSRFVRSAAAVSRTCPGADFLEICQNRLLEKSSLSAAGFPTTPFAAVESAMCIVQAGASLGWPLVVKTARSGYDGKGQVVVRSADEAEGAWQRLGRQPSIAEQWIEFEAEVSMIAARNARGDIACYPLLENHHANHILDVTLCPTRPELQSFADQAEEICRGIAERFGVVGLFCVEFFVARDGRLMINEMAPRPHNSGHLTIEAFTCSQFEQQVRAMCNLPLVVPRMLVPAAAMVNLLGDVWFSAGESQASNSLSVGEHWGEPAWEKVFACACAHLHLYGKSEPRIGRKMGHITLLADAWSPHLAVDARRVRTGLGIAVE